MKKLVVLFSAAFLMGATALWAQDSSSQSRSQSSTDPSTSTSSAQSATQSETQGTAQSWTGKLVDADCRQSSPNSACTASSATTHFGLLTSDGKFYKLDSSSNSKAKTAVQGMTGDQTVTVTGRLEGEDTISADSIRAQTASSSSSQYGTPGAASSDSGNASSSSSSTGSPYGSQSSSSQSSQSQQSQGTMSSSQTAAAGQQSWTGTLVDADCRDANATAFCTPSASTKHFGLVTAAGEFHRLDAASASKAEACLRSQAGQPGQVSQNMVVTGRMEGDRIIADTIELQGSSGNASNPSSSSQYGSQSTAGSDNASSQSSTSQSSSSQSDTSRSSNSQSATQPGSSSSTSQSDASSSSSSTAAGEEKTYTGTLHDADCREKDPQGTCPAKASTSNYGLLSEDGKFYKIDSASNSKIQEALRKRSDAGDASSSANEKLRVSITGTASEDTLTVTTITVQ